MVGILPICVCSPCTGLPRERCWKALQKTKPEDNTTLASRVDQAYQRVSAVLAQLPVAEVEEEAAAAGEEAA